MRINLVTVGIAILLGSILVVLLIIGVMLTQPKEIPLSTRPAVITVLPLVPTSTAQPTMTLEPTQTEDEFVLQDEQDVSNLKIGDYVEIYGTGGDGLRIRKTPGLDSEVLFLGLESEIFIIKDGPIKQDGFIWWQLESPNVAGLGGWAAGNYLALVEQP